MPQILLTDLIIIFTLSTAVVWLGQLLRLPSIVSFLLVGLLAGPYGFGLVKNLYAVEAAAELGVVLLMFTIGMSFSFRNLLRIKYSLLLGGSLQVGLMILGGLIISWCYKLSYKIGIFWGCLAALSSTAIVLKLWQERTTNFDIPPARVSLAILIFQDLIVVPMIIFAPLLAGQNLQEQTGWWLTIKGFTVISLLAATTKWLIPQVLDRVTATRNHELFLVTIILLCLGIAWLTYWAGLSRALGAFLAGLIISESPYSHQALGNLLPLRDIFSSLFFVSIGMLLDIKVIKQKPLLVVTLTLTITGIKALVATIAILALGLPLRVAIPAGLGLSQVGEFSFILSQQGLEHKLLNRHEHQWFLVVSVLTMAVTPYLLTIESMLSIRFRTKNNHETNKIIRKKRSGYKQYNQHVVIIGFGFNGQNVAQACQIIGIPYVILEMNPGTVRQQSNLGEPILFGDAMNPAVLKYVGVHKSKILVITITDPIATRSIVSSVRAINHNLYLIVRTRFIEEIQLLRNLGANEVVSEEYETAIEIFTRVLKRFWVPINEVQHLVNQMRAENYEILREATPINKTTTCDIRYYLGETKIETITIQAKSTIIGHSIGEINFRKMYGITILALRRGAKIISTPKAGTKFKVGDLVVLIGPPEIIITVESLFRNSKKKYLNNPQ